MRDLILLVLLLALCWMAWRKPWVGVVGLALLSTLHPQAYGSPLFAQIPVYKLLFLATTVAAIRQWVRSRRWPVVGWEWRLSALLILFADFVLTSHFALSPGAAVAHLVGLAGVLPPVVLAWLLLDTRRKFDAFMFALAFGVTLAAFKGGWWAITTGFSDRVYGPEGSQIGGNNEFALALAVVVPLLVACLKSGVDRPARLALGAAIAACYCAALASWSRGGVVALAVMSALLVWNSRRKGLAITLAAAGLAVAAVNLPQEWRARMGTLADMQADQSFGEREAVWRRGVQAFVADPLTGAGFESWQQLNARDVDPENMATRDWHSATVELLAEHGLPGLLLWLGLLAGSMFELTRQRARAVHAGDGWLADRAAMLRASLVTYGVGGLTLGNALWELFFLLLTCALVLKRLDTANSKTVGFFDAGPPGIPAAASR